ncbi:hypothetical protein PAHAL_5G486000 [Panicum hallii]|uniref:Uncharacterized protein n=1 Tax=Panicum hallii TaxID=206008 RepID=A0A2T8IP04_9POAL|nr:hypothetical protein PAHAL_5G486000 [Panicum hallii]
MIYMVIYIESAQSNGVRAPFGDQTNIKVPTLMERN